MAKAIILIQLDKGVKRSWCIVRDMINRSDTKYHIDLRKASKKNVPLSIECTICNTVLNIRRVKDFPLRNKKCKCGHYIIKWEESKS